MADGDNHPGRKGAGTYFYLHKHRQNYGRIKTVVLRAILMYGDLSGHIRSLTQVDSRIKVLGAQRDRTHRL